jgi:cytochrome P450 family 3 subfamily A
LREEILAQAVIFFLAGFDTTANTLHYLFYHLALDQDVQHKVIEELTEVIGENVSFVFHLIQIFITLNLFQH